MLITAAVAVGADVAAVQTAVAAKPSKNNRKNR